MGNPSSAAHFSGRGRVAVRGAEGEVMRCSWIAIAFGLFGAMHSPSYTYSLGVCAPDKLMLSA